MVHTVPSDSSRLTDLSEALDTFKKFTKDKENMEKADGMEDCCASKEMFEHSLKVYEKHLERIIGRWRTR